MGQMDPHIFAVAEEAYRRMARSAVKLQLLGTVYENVVTSFFSLSVCQSTHLSFHVVWMLSCVCPCLSVCLSVCLSYI